VHPRNVPLPDPTEIRKLRFEPYSYEIDRCISEEGKPPISSTEQLADRETYDAKFLNEMVTPAIQRDIAERLHEAGLSVNLTDTSFKSLINWRVGADFSVFWAIPHPVHVVFN
jgi:hypothetical protein